MVDFQDYPFSQGSVLFIQREQVHAFDFSNEPQGTAVVFTQAFLDSIHANMKLAKLHTNSLEQGTLCTVLSLDELPPRSNAEPAATNYD